MRAGRRLALLCTALATTLGVAGAVRYARMAWPFEYRRLAALPAIPALPAGAGGAFAEAHARAAGAPADAEAVGRLGMQFQAYGLVSDAAACYERAAGLAPERFEWRYYLGRALAAEGRTGRAVEVLQAAVDGYPEYVPALLALADLYLEAGAPARSGELYRAAARQDAQCSAAWWGLGRVAAMRGDRQGVIETMRRALEISPDFGEARYALAMAERGAGPGGVARGDGRAAELQRVRGSASRRLVRDPLMEAVYAERRDGAAEAATGMVYLRVGRFAEAADALGRAVALRGDDPQVRFHYGRALEGIGDVSRAIEQYRAGVAVAPNHAGLRVALGEALARAGHGQEAIEQLTAAVRLDGGDARARCALAGELAKAGRREAARSVIREGLKLSPGDVELEKALALLGEAPEQGGH